MKIKSSLNSEHKQDLYVMLYYLIGAVTFMTIILIGIQERFIDYLLVGCVLILLIYVTVWFMINYRYEKKEEYEFKKFVFNTVLPIYDSLTIKQKRKINGIK